MKESGLLFEWDAEKNRRNFIKHGIRFETAAKVFRDKNRIEIYDELHSGTEDRYQTIGLVHDVLFVVYTERRNNIRIISARPANRVERGLYYDRDLYSV